MTIGKHRAIAVADGQIARIIHEGDKMYARPRRKILQHMIAADSVSPIRRKRRTVREEEDVPHPSPRETSGPATFASRNGSFGQARTISAYLGLSGLISRGGPSHFRA